MSQFEQIIKNGTWSEYFQAQYDPVSYEYNMALSERQLFTQSNARVLLGQDNMGRMHFIAAPHEKDYALPTRRRMPHQHITACPGMYYQVDLTLFLGKAYYELEGEDGTIIRNGQKGSITRYLNDFLPWTVTENGKLRMDTFSIAPVLEHSWRYGMKTLPLPGPSGAIYGMRIKNNGDTGWKGKIKFVFSDLFMSKYEHCGDPVETRAFPAQYMQVDRNLLLMQRPEGYTGLWMKGGVWKKKNSTYEGIASLCIEPGEEVIIETNIAVSEKTDGISEAMSFLYMHDAVEWIEITDQFWKKYLGSLEVHIQNEPELSGKCRDIHIRNILDNFNCIQTDETGRVLVHWQGAPSHCMGRMWGIDVEPTTLSFIHIFPELGERLIEYMAERNEPCYSVYEDHSVPIMMAPLVMAGEYYTYTANKQYFIEHPEILKRLDEIWEKIIGFCKNGCALIPSRYSSDGIVMRRYDHGTNVKFWYASKGYGMICKALKRENADLVFCYMERLKKDIEKLMIVDGPFGKQISGGTNLGEQDNFYMDEDFSYYDGEDSSSVLAPIYGIYDFSYEPWINYHRFARSMYCSNYDPEMDVLRWFPYGGALDGTAYVSQLGGAITKKEMKYSLNNMINSAVDQNGSLYWWPKAENMRRMIARCSQGQGSWIVQYIKQWLGIQINVEKKILKIEPRGLLDSYTWKSALFGCFTFDISYHESEEGSSIRIANKNDVEFQVIFGCRAYGAGAEGAIQELHGTVAPQEILELTCKPHKVSVDEYFRTDLAVLNEFSDKNGILLQHFGFLQPIIESVDHKNIFLFRLVLGNNNEDILEQVNLQFMYPSCMKMREKVLRMWDDGTDMQADCCIVQREKLDAKSMTVIPVWTELDPEYSAADVWYDAHPFLGGKKGKEGNLWIASETQKLDGEIRVKMNYKKNAQCLCKEISIPVKAITKKKLDEFKKTFLGAMGE